MKKILLAISVWLTLLVGPAFANNFTNCGEREAVIANLAEKAGETHQWTLLNMSAPNAPGTTSLYADENDGTWTIIAESPAYPGLACLIQYGVGWNGIEWVAPEPEPEGEDA